MSHYKTDSSFHEINHNTVQ